MLPVERGRTASTVSGHGCRAGDADAFSSFYEH